MEISETPWGDVDKTELDQRVAELYAAGDFSQADVGEVYAYSPAEAFGETADGNPELLTSKLGGPHHEVEEDGAILLNRAGVIALAGALAGARGGVDWPDAWVTKAIAHVARHYAELDLELPESLKNGTVRVRMDKSGCKRWLAVSSCAVWDLEGQLVSTEAIDSSLKSLQSASAENAADWEDLRVEHLSASRIGACDFQQRVGILLVEAGAFDDNSRGDKAYETLRADNSGKYRVSIGFYYQPQDLVNDVYRRLQIFERSVTTRPANPYTAIGITKGGVYMGKVKVDKVTQETLEELVGADAATQIIAESKSLADVKQAVALKTAEASAESGDKELNEDGQPVQRFGDMLTGLVGQSIRFWADEWLITGMLSQEEHGAILAAADAAVSSLREALPEEVAARERQGWGFFSRGTPREAHISDEQVTTLTASLTTALTEQEAHLVLDDALLETMADKVAGQMMTSAREASETMKQIQQVIVAWNAEVREMLNQLLRADTAKVQDALDSLPKARVYRATQQADGDNGGAKVTQTAPISPLADLEIYQRMGRQ